MQFAVGLLPQTTNKMTVLTISTKQSENFKNSSKRWSTIRNVVHKSARLTSPHRHTSMTPQEKQFLSLLQSAKEQSKTSVTATQKQIRSAETLTSFSQIVDAAIARAKLRQEVSLHLSKLTLSEAQFLRDLVNNENVTKQQLEFAKEVLSTDPLYRLDYEDGRNDYIEEGPRKKEDELDTCSLPSVMSTSPIEEVLHPDNRSKVRIQRVGPNFELLYCESRLDAETHNQEHNATSSRRDGIEADDTSSKTMNHPGPFSYSTWKIQTNASSNVWYDDEDQTFPILGMYKNDANSRIDESNRVLSPPILNSLRAFLPYSVAEDNFWLKFSLSRDGANLQTLYDSIRQSSPTLLAIETSYGEVFGAFTTSPWREHKNFYGSCEAFLWRLKQSRYFPCKSMEEQFQLERQVDCFKWSRANRNVQFSNRNKLIVGGGLPDEDSSWDVDDSSFSGSSWGMGIVLKSDLFQGVSAPCVTFQSPCLSQNEESFEATNIEVWVSYSLKLSQAVSLCFNV